MVIFVRHGTSWGRVWCSVSFRGVSGTRFDFVRKLKIVWKKIGIHGKHVPKNILTLVSIRMKKNRPYFIRPIFKRNHEWLGFRVTVRICTWVHTKKCLYSERYKNICIWTGTKLFCIRNDTKNVFLYFTFWFSWQNLKIFHEKQNQEIDNVQEFQVKLCTFFENQVNKNGKKKCILKIYTNNKHFH